MKQLLLLACVIVAFSSKAQKSGKIIYDEVTKMEINFPEGMALPEGFEMPSENVVTRALYFSESESIYKNVPQEPIVNKIKSEGFHLEIKNDIPEDEYYKNLSNGTKTEKRDFLDRTFLMKGDLKDFKWKISPDQEKVLDYVVQKATTTMDTLEIIAWFAPQIQISNGPDKYGKLPGMILKLEIPELNRVITAKEVSFEEVKEEIVAPKKGKKISEEEFEKIRVEKLAEMRAQYGGKGGVFIQTIEN
ncbi:MAG: GLPGLI family protein [Marinoscillum sp.]